MLETKKLIRYKINLIKMKIKIIIYINKIIYTKRLDLLIGS